ncbi:MAG TPA: ribonuclease III, partial [bacterium]|nr:ribonuclease III [bacterium]
RLEFLGDSVLGMAVARHVFLLNPDVDEGHLSKLKSFLASRPVLAKWAKEIHLGEYLYLGAGEESTGGRHRPSLLANAIEAVIGAVYLDGGFEQSAGFIDTWLSRQPLHLSEDDYKSRLQELLQKNHKTTPDYEVAGASGPDHDRTFVVTVRLGRKILGSGSGKNKKEAQQDAARDALTRLKQG